MCGVLYTKYIFLLPYASLFHSLKLISKEISITSGKHFQLKSNLALFFRNKMDYLSKKWRRR